MESRYKEVISMKKRMPNKATFIVSGGGEKETPLTKIQKGGDLRSKACQNAGKAKQTSN
jgi:hypothetical protein